MSDDDITRSAGATSPSLGRIGPYKLLAVLGEGGMGIVYLAQQEGALRRRVALKVIKPGMDSRQVLARFESERQALAVLDHPNIAKVFDAGSTEQGHPYFVMEHFAGLPITDYCDRHLLSNRNRLGLFLQVCDAIQHAHRRGILHRDIKPSNVLVSEQDGKPVPKVIDFGVAKATSQPLTERTLFTEQGVLLGTPEYMSPEQADSSVESIDARTDVYSLGVLLYELLVGSTPIDPKVIRGAGYAEMKRVIRENQPPTPSDRVSRMGAAALDVSRRRQRDVRALRRELRGDLDAIVLKALRKERALRYASATELEEDLRRHLAGERVLARKTSWRALVPGFALVLAPALICLVLAQTPASQELERQGLGALFRLRGVRPPPEQVAIVAIDRASYSALGLRGPTVPRPLQAELVRTLHREEARAIAYNVLFSGPTSPQDDRILATAFQEAGNVALGTVKIGPLDAGVYAPFADVAAGLGQVDLPADPDGVVRSAWPQREGLLSLSAEAYRLWTGDPAPGDVRLIDYYGPARTIPTVSLYQALKPESLPPGFFLDKLVFVGWAFPPGVWTMPATESLDVFKTSFGDVQTGVEIQASIAANLLERRQLRALTPAAKVVLLALLPVLAAPLLLGLRGAWFALGVVVLEGAAWGLACFAFTRFGVWVPVMLVSLIELPLISLASAWWRMRRRRHPA